MMWIPCHRTAYVCLSQNYLTNSRPLLMWAHREVHVCVSSRQWGACVTEWALVIVQRGEPTSVCERGRWWNQSSGALVGALPAKLSALRDPSPASRQGFQQGRPLGSDLLPRHKAGRKWNGRVMFGAAAAVTSEVGLCQRIGWRHDGEGGCSAPPCPFEPPQTSLS